MNLQEVNVTKIEIHNIKELSDDCYSVCAFCDKIVRIQKFNFYSCQKLSGKNFYCPFCLRNNHHHRSSRNILGFSFRGILGYYYNKIYLKNPKKLYFSQIKKIIENHQSMGLQNPVLNYDPLTFMWYADFNKIGNKKGHAPYSELKETTNLIFKSLRFQDHLDLLNIPNIEDKMFVKFEEAFDLFYQQRKRPKDRRFLIPTLVGLDKSENEEFFEDTRSFVKNWMVLK